jgi:hypothetical protein
MFPTNPQPQPNQSAQVYAAQKEREVGDTFGKLKGTATYQGAAKVWNR